MMPTQEERIAVLEKFQQESGVRLKEIEENTTIMLGVVQAQGWDIKKIFRRLETIDDRLIKIDEHLETTGDHLVKMDGHLETTDGRLNTIEQHLGEQKILLTQILERLPEKP